MNVKNVIIGISLTTLTIASGIVGFSGLFKQQSKTYFHKDWMKDISDLTPIKEVNIPGAHDTMALRSIGDLAGQCQSLSLENQLNIGVRFLDIRLQLVRDELIAVHGIVDQKASFAQIVYTCESFLKNNPTEFIFMSVKEEEKAKSSSLSFEDALKQYAKGDYWNLDTSLPVLTGLARSKIHLISRYKDSTIGTPAYNGWAVNATFTMNGIHIQDEYKVNDIEHKKTVIKECLEESSLLYQMKINFLSGYMTNSFPPSYAPSVANTINPWIMNELQNYPTNRGVVLFDFVTEEIMEGWFK